MEVADNGSNANAPAPKPRRNRWIRVIAHIEREFHKYQAEKKTETTSDRMARRTANATVWIAIFTVILAVAGSITLYEVITGSHDTHALAVAAGNQAEKLSNVSDAADKIRKAADNMVIQDQRIADNASASLAAGRAENSAALESSSKQNATSLAATVESSHLDQRAWLVVTNLRLSGEPTQDVGATVTVSIANTGRTPALQLINQSRLILLNIDPAGPNFDLPVNPRSRAMVAPGVAGVEFKTDTITLKNLREVSFYTSGNYKIYIQALIRYNDAFNKSHWTTLCAYHIYGSRLDDFQYCQNGNDVDEEKGQTPN